jgi:hypothetical protein
MTNKRFTPSESRKQLANIFRLAARQMENKTGRGMRTHGIDYPCWNIAEVDGQANWEESASVDSFLGIFSDRDDLLARSDHFLEEIDAWDENDACVLALCFAAAITERP